MFILLSFILPLVLPWGKWLTRVAIFIVTAIVVLWLENWYEMSSPDFKGTPGDAFVPVLLFLPLALFGCGIVVRLIIGSCLSTRRKE